MSIIEKTSRTRQCTDCGEVFHISHGIMKHECTAPVKTKKTK